MSSATKNQSRCLQSALFVLVIAIGAAVYFSVSKKPKIDTLAYAYPDFQTFPTPRDFDAPGMVFRIGSDGVRYDVVDLSKRIAHDLGAEYVPEQKTRRKFSGDILNTLLAGGITAQGGVSSSYDASLILKGVQRDKTTDVGLDNVLRDALKGIRLKADSRYFVIRETIAATAIHYDFGSTDGLSTQSKAARPGEQVNLSASRSDAVGVDQAFARPMRIFYKPEELEFESSGLTGEVQVERHPVTSTIMWTSQSEPAEGH